MSKQKVFKFFRQITSTALIVTLLVASFIGTDLYYNYGGSTAFAAELVGTSNGSSGNQTIKGAQNMGTLDNSTGTTYWYAGNAFYGMNRNGTEFGENYDTKDWLLVDTDAMWGGEYLYSTWGNAYRADGSDLYTSSEDATSLGDVNKVYYQKILTYGERLWTQYGSSWFTGKEAGAVGTATVTTTNNSYRTFEDYVGGATNDIGNYNYWIGATTSSNIANNSYTISNVKKWYETGSTDTTKYGTLTTPQTATTINNSVTSYINSSNYNGITEDELGVKSSNIYSILDAHLYAPSVTELQANETVYKQIIKNVYADYSAETNETGAWGPNGGWFSAAKSTATANPAGHLYDRTRANLWSRSFSGLRMNYSSFDSWVVNVYGNLYSDYNLTGSHAVAPAFNLDTDSVVMARSAQASVTPSSELASYNPNELGSDVVFSLESNALSLSTSIAGQKLNNVVSGQTYDIAYSGASTSGEAHNAAASANLYVSAAIYDENDTIVYYGQLAPVDSSGEGTVSLTIPELEAGKQYKLALFEEQINGAYNTTTPSGKSITTYTTDYVSEMNVATFTLDSISANVNEGAALKEETSYTVDDIANMITVTSASQGELVFGSSYTIKSVYGDATVDGTTITTGDNGSKNAKELVFEVAYLDESMSVVPSTTVTFTVNSSSSVSDDTYQGDQASDKDENGFYTWKDKTTNITWKYKTNDAGNITYLYTVNDPSPLIDAAGTLNLPKTVAGLTVIGIGGGTEDKPVVSMGDGDWVSISFPETVTTINDYAFVKATQEQANIIIPKHITTIGAKAFYKSSIASVKVNGMTGTIGYLAFGNCVNLKNVNIKGAALTLAKEAFSGSGITELTVSGTVFIKENAFKNVTGITKLYLPNGVDVYANAFNGCTGIVVLESDMSILTNDSFAGCDSIHTLILNDNSVRVEYDWNGHTASTDRNIYVKNGNTLFQFYGKDSTYYSAYGTSGNVRVIYDEGTDEGTSLEPIDNVLTAITKTLASHSSKYKEYYEGQAAKVTYVYDGAKSTEQIMEDDAVGNVNVSSEVQTGIEAIFDGTLLTTQAIDKNKVTVTSLFGNAEGMTYDGEHFYVIRSEEFNSLSRNGGVTEEAVAAFEPLKAKDVDLTNGLSAAIVVFNTVAKDGENVVYSPVADNGYFYTMISIRVEEYTDKDYIEEEYGSYEAIVDEINGLTGEIENMEGSMKDIITNINDALGTSFDVNAENLVEEYEKAVAALSEALSSSVTENTNNIKEVQALIESVNNTYGSNIELSDNATAEEINTAITKALKVISDDQADKNASITSLKQQYVEIAQMLSDYMSNTENLEADAVDGTTIADIKQAISTALSDLNAAKEELSDIDAALNNLYDALDSALSNIQGLATADENSGEDSTADKINSITGMIQTLSASYEANNEYLRSCIAEIDLAFGYGNYVKYNDKYVFYIFPDDVYYIKGTDSRVYLESSDGGATFTEVPNQDVFAEEFDAKNGVKFFYLSDETNGWQPYQSNPLNDYKKAMAALLNGFNTSTDNTVALINTVNSICGYESGDSGYIMVPENATADEITAAKNAALTAVNEKLLSLDAQNRVFASEYAEAAKALSDFMQNDYGDAVSSENAAEVTAAVKAAVSELNALRSEMEDINNALSGLYGALEEAFGSMGLGGTASVAGEEDESTADKIESISGMIAIITESYNQLNAAYTELESEYQSILNYVYGEDEKTVDQVTPEQVKAQIEANKQEAIDAAVEEALRNAENLNGDATEIQNSIAGTIDAIMDGEDVSTAGMSDALVSSLEKVQDMQASVASMQTAVEGYASVLSTIQSALGLDDTATSSEIIAAIQGLKDQVATLSAKVTELQTENASLQSQLAASGNYKDGYDAGYAEGVASVDVSENSTPYKNGYSAGYAAGLAANPSDSGNSSEDYVNAYNSGFSAGVASVDTSKTGPTYTSGYNAGYVAGFNAGNTSSSASDTSSQITQLTTQVSNLTKENSTLSSEVTTLKTDKTSLASEVTALTSANTALTNKVTELGNKVSTLTTDNSELKTQVTTLTSQVNAYKNTSSSSNTKPSTSNSTSTVANTSTTANTSTQAQTSTGAQSTLKNDKTDSTENNTGINAESSETEVSKNSSFVASSGTKTEIGTAVETALPTTTEINAVAQDQEAETKMIKLSNQSILVDTNAASYEAASTDSKEMAYLIITYYMNHLEELGELGSEDIVDAATDESKSVSLEVVASIDVEPSDEQLSAMSKDENAELIVSSDKIEDGELYFVVHESNKRTDTFDVLLATAENNEITMNLPDFSPVTIAKVTISDAEKEQVITADATENAEFVSENVEETDNGSTGSFRTVMYVLIILAFVGIIAVFVLMKLQRDGKISGRKK